MKKSEAAGLQIVILPFFRINRASAAEVNNSLKRSLLILSTGTDKKDYKIQDMPKSKLDQVFCFFFFAAGNRMLFRINLYPGEFG